MAGWLLFQRCPQASPALLRDSLLVPSAAHALPCRAHTSSTHAPPCMDRGIRARHDLLPLKDSSPIPCHRALPGGGASSGPCKSRCRLYGCSSHLASPAWGLPSLQRARSPSLAQSGPTIAHGACLTCAPDTEQEQEQVTSLLCSHPMLSGWTGGGDLYRDKSQSVQQKTNSRSKLLAHTSTP